MGLVDLPFERLDRILYLSIPLGIDALTLTCGTIYACAADPPDHAPQRIVEEVAARRQLWLTATRLESNNPRPASRYTYTYY